MVFGVTEPISDDPSTVLWQHNHYPGAGVLAEIMSRRIFYDSDSDTYLSTPAKYAVITILVAQFV